MLHLWALNLLKDAPTLEMHRALVLLEDIIRDIEILIKQYGPLMDHQNEEATSRVLAPVGV